MAQKTRSDMAQKILGTLSKIANPPTDEKGNLDTIKLNELPEVQKVVARLKRRGITSAWLQDNGFLVASMVLHF